VLLTALPAQAGFVGICLFQCGVVAASAWLAFRVAAQLHLPLPWLAVLFTYAAPDYFQMQSSGLTEPLFGLVLVAGVALAVHDRLGWSALVMSWLPFARSEGFLLLVVWAVYLVVRGQWRYLPLLSLGYVVYSLVGAWVLGDLGWVFGRNAYQYQVALYGHGGWLDFIRRLPGLLGWVLVVLFGVGMGWGLLSWVQFRWRRSQARWLAELLLLYGSIVVYIAAHSAFWALGLFQSFGMTRVLAALIPLMAVVALSGLDAISRLVPTEPARTRLRLGLAALVFIYPCTGLNLALRWQRDFGPQGDLVLGQQLADWLKATYPQGPKPLVTAMPSVFLQLGIDPFAPSVHLPGVVMSNEPLPPGTVVVWDDRLAVTDHGLTREHLLRDSRYQLRWQGSTPRNLTKPQANDSTHVAVFERVQ
jgi:hypothetical protein